MIPTGLRAFVSIVCAFATVGACAKGKAATELPPASIIIAMKATDEGRPATALFMFRPGVPVPVREPPVATVATVAAIVPVALPGETVATPGLGGIGPRIEQRRKNAGGARTASTVSAIALAITAIGMSLGAWLRRG